MRLLIIRPCRVSFALCVLLSLSLNADEAIHIALGEPPRFQTRRLF